MSARLPTHRYGLYFVALFRLLGGRCCLLARASAIERTRLAASPLSAARGNSATASTNRGSVPSRSSGRCRPSSRIRLRNHSAASSTLSPASWSASTVVRRSSSTRPARRRGTNAPCAQLRTVFGLTPMLSASSSKLNPSSSKALIRSLAPSHGSGANCAVDPVPFGDRDARDRVFGVGLVIQTPFRLGGQAAGLPPLCL
jgi:hypothetical protein